MKRFAVILLTALVFAHCADSDGAKDSKPKPSTPKKTDKKTVAKTTPTTPVFTGPRLEFLKSIPGSIDGCGEFFTYDLECIINWTTDRIFLHICSDFLS